MSAQLTVWRGRFSQNAHDASTLPINGVCHHYRRRRRQTNGATAQAIGWALYEQLHLGDGTVNADFADYCMPTAEALPALRSALVESNDPNGPYGAKGASETAILPGAAAIANAVHDAIGVRINTLPITPEKVLAALRARAQGKTHA